MLYERVARSAGSIVRAFTRKLSEFTKPSPFSAPQLVSSHTTSSFHVLETIRDCRPVLTICEGQSRPVSRRKSVEAAGKKHSEIVETKKGTNKYTERKA